MSKEILLEDLIITAGLGGVGGGYIVSEVVHLVEGKPVIRVILVAGGAFVVGGVVNAVSAVRTSRQKDRKDVTPDDSDTLNNPPPIPNVLTNPSVPNVLT